MNPPSPTVRLTPELFPSAARLLAEAFHDNPAHIYFCPDAEARPGQLEWLLGGGLRTQPDLSRSFCFMENKTVLAMGFWTRSDGPQPTLLGQIRAGIAMAPFRIGLEGTRRIFEVLAGNDRSLAEAMGDRKYLYLNNMVVCGARRGTGLGGRLLTEQIEAIDRAHPGTTLALSTQTLKNVRFYRRLGFEVIGEGIIGRGELAFRNWTMQRL